MFYCVLMTGFGECARAAVAENLGIKLTAPDSSEYAQKDGIYAE